MKVHELYMQKALQEAQKAFDENEVPVGAVIVYKNEIIGRAHNQITTLKDPTAHAEMIAITQAAAFLKNERLIDCDIYVTIEPCSMCTGAMILARLRNVYFGTSDKKTGACGTAVDLTKPGMFNHNLNVTGGVLEKECREIIQSFFLKKR